MHRVLCVVKRWCVYVRVFVCVRASNFAELRVLYDTMRSQELLCVCVCVFVCECVCANVCLFACVCVSTFAGRCVLCVVKSSCVCVCLSLSLSLSLPLSLSLSLSLPLSFPSPHPLSLSPSLPPLSLSLYYRSIIFLTYSSYAHRKYQQSFYKNTYKIYKITIPCEFFGKHRSFKGCVSDKSKNCKWVAG